MFPGYCGSRRGRGEVLGGIAVVSTGIGELAVWKADRIGLRSVVCGKEKMGRGGHVTKRVYKELVAFCAFCMFSAEATNQPVSNTGDLQFPAYFKAFHFSPYDIPPFSGYFRSNVHNSSSRSADHWKYLSPGEGNRQARVAQWLEHWSYEPRVVSSSLTSSIFSLSVRCEAVGRGFVWGNCY